MKNSVKTMLSLFSVVIAGVVLSTMNTAYASEIDKPIRYGTTQDTEYFYNLTDDEKVLALPNGGFLHGEGTVYDIKEPNKAIEVYNSETDPKSITVGQAKKVLEDQKSNTMTGTLSSENITRGTTPPSKLINLSYGGSYTSNYFSGRGWRFAGYLFAAVNSSGSNLRWESHGDQGCIGTKQQAINTLDSGFAEGTLINNNEYLYLYGWVTKTYYVFNPPSGVYYYVGNVD